MPSQWPVAAFAKDAFLTARPSPVKDAQASRLRVTPDKAVIARDRLAG
jgi:hypothetical protein